MGLDQARRESVHTVSTKRCRIGPYRRGIDNLSGRGAYTPAVLRCDSGNTGRSSTDYTWRLPAGATSNLPGSRHGLYWRAGVCLKSVWPVDYVSADPVNTEQDQGRGETVDR